MAPAQASPVESGPVEASPVEVSRVTPSLVEASLVEARGVGRAVDLLDGRRLTIMAGVDLTIAPGDRISIVGRSGSGKSTLLNLLGLLDAPTEGELAFLGDDVRRLSSGRRDRLRGREIGFVFQQFNLLQGRTAIENVQTPLLYSGDRSFWRREQIARDMLERVGLGERLEVRPERLSGGEQQRVAIARALVRRPRLILADEPTGALDLETGSEVMALIESVADETGAALVTITHDPAIAARAGRRFRLAAGRLEPVDEVDAAAYVDAAADVESGRGDGEPRVAAGEPS